MLSPGTILDDRFEISDFLGAGSFGAVYRARQLVFGHPMREVALKLFKEERIAPDNVRDVFADAVTLISLAETEQCPPEVARRLVRIFDMGIVRNPHAQAYLAMQLVRGGKTLHWQIQRWARGGGMVVATALRFLRELLVPLAWMHTLDPPLLHGDLKPDNVLLSETEELVLTDFGLAARLPLGTRGGAVAYQAPETLLGGHGEIAADMYAVGIIWYEMITGRHPFATVGAEATVAGDDAAFARAHHEARRWPMRAADPHKAYDEDFRIVPPSELNREMREHPQLENMLRKCLAFRQSERYPNARLLLTDLDRYLATADAGTIVLPRTDVSDVAPGERPAAASVQDVLALLAAGNATRALQQAQALRQRLPKSMPALMALARAQLMSGNVDQARISCDEARKLDRNNPEALEMMAEVLEAQGMPATAGPLRQQAVQLRNAQKR